MEMTMLFKITAVAVIVVLAVGLIIEDVIFRIVLQFDEIPPGLSTPRQPD